MELQTARNVHSGTYEILLYEQIFDGIGQMVASDIKLLDEEPSVNDVHIRINSPGGALFDAISIHAAIKNSDTKVTTFIDGVAASAAGLIAMSGDEVKMSDIGRLFIHEVQGAQDEALRQFTEIVTDLISKRTGKPNEEAKQMMVNETWLGPQEAKEQGFVDEVFDFDVEVEPETATNAAELAEVVNKAFKKETQKVPQPEFHSKPKNMNIRELLGLDSQASDQEVENAINTLQKEKKEQKERLDHLENKFQEYQEQQAQQVVENAIKEGKLDPGKKQAMVERAKNDLEGFNTLLDSIPSQKGRSATNDIKNNGGAKKGGSLNPDNKTFRELEKESPKKLKKIKDEDPDYYNELFENAYKTE